MSVGFSEETKYIEKMSYLDCYIASIRLEELSRINGKPFYCGKNLYRLRVLTSYEPHVKVMKYRESQNKYFLYDIVSLHSENTILDVVKAVLNALPSQDLRSLGMCPLTIEQLAHYLES